MDNFCFADLMRTEDDVVRDSWQALTQLTFSGRPARKPFHTRYI